MISSSSSLKFRMSSDADTDSKILLASGRSSPGLEVLNVPTQDYKGRISDSKGSDFLSKF